MVIPKKSGSQSQLVLFQDSDFILDIQWPKAVEKKSSPKIKKIYLS